MEREIRPVEVAPGRTIDSVYKIKDGNSDADDDVDCVLPELYLYSCGEMNETALTDPFSVCFFFLCE